MASMSRRLGSAYGVRRAARRVSAETWGRLARRLMAAVNGGREPGGRAVRPPGTGPRRAPRTRGPEPAPSGTGVRPRPGASAGRCC